ncbi:MAG TPA: hypothetical protein PL115_04145 [Bacteroidales bacterium]|nr:hypothetical protein [Bacteroidales bacterium]
MPEGIITIDKIVIINKIVLPSVVWWIDINNVNQPFMRLFEQIQALQIIPFKDKVIDIILQRLIQFNYPILKVS